MGIVDVLVEDVEAGSDLGAEEARFGEAEFRLEAGQAARELHVHLLPGSEQVLLAEVQVADDAFRCRVADAEADVAAVVLHHFDRQQQLVVGRATLALELDGLEEAERHDALAGALQEQRVDGVAFRDAQLPSDDVVTGLFVTRDVDALGVEGRAVLDGEVDADGLGLLVAYRHRLDAGKREALLGQVERDLLDGLFDHLFVVGAAVDELADGGDGAQIGRLETAVELARTHDIAGAFLDCEGDPIGLAVRGLDGLGRLDPGVGVAVLMVVAAQQFGVLLDAFGVVEGGRLQDVEPAAFAGGDDALEFLGREGGVADEGDAVDFGDLGFRDLVDDLHLAVRPLGHARIDGRRHAAL